MRRLCAVIPDPLEGTPRRLDGTADRGGRSRTVTSRPALLAVCALAWITSSAVYLYPGVKEEVDEKRYLHRVEKLHTPVLPLECGRARGVQIETSSERTGTRKGAG